MRAPPENASGAERANSRWGEILSYRPIYSVLALLIAWEVASRLALINPYFLPPPSIVIERAYQILLGEKLLQHLAGTLLRSLAALALCIAIGVPLGVAMARIAPVRWFFDPLISLGLPVPKIALWPIFVLWFGFFDTSKILLTAFACAFPVVSATYLGTRNVDKFVVWSALNLGTGPHRLLWKVVFRAAAPEILTGIQTVLPIAIIIVVLTEMLSGGTGLGAMIMYAGRFADIKTVLVGVLAASLMGYAMIKLFEQLRRRLLAWHQETSVTA